MSIIFRYKEAIDIHIPIISWAKFPSSLKTDMVVALCSLEMFLLRRCDMTGLLSEKKNPLRENMITEITPEVNMAIVELVTNPANPIRKT